MTTPDEIAYDPPQPNAALVVGPDDVLVLSFSTMTPQERDGHREHLPVAVLRGGAK